MFKSWSHLFLITLILSFGLFCVGTAKAQDLKPNIEDILGIDNIYGCSEIDEKGCDTPFATSTEFFETITKLKNDFCVHVPVLLYHHIKPYELAKKEGHEMLTVDNLAFENQLRNIKENGYTALSAYELVDALRFKKQLPQKSIVLTLDDGYDDLYTYAFPLAKKYNIKLNAMIPTGLVGRPGYVGWPQLIEMQNSKLIFSYNHTYSHFPLSQADAKRKVEEMTYADLQLRLYLGGVDRIITYPYGVYDDQTIEILKAQDFEGAFTTQHGRTQCLSNIYRLSRDHIGNAPLSSYSL